jgi:hypothetical protein
MRRIGMLLGGAERDPQIVEGLAAFKTALEKLGWNDGRNIQIDTRFAAADLDRMRVLAKELVALQPDVLVGHTTGVVTALQREAKTIPIVFVIVSDPVGSGFVESLPRPGGNITGFINIEVSLSGKWIEMLKEIVPRVTRAVLMFNPETAPYFPFYQQPFEAAARLNGIEPIAAPVQTTADIERVFDKLGNLSDTGLVLPPDVFTSTKVNLDLVTSLAARTHLPTIYPYRLHGRRRRPDFPRHRQHRSVSARAGLYRSYTQGRQARRSACPASDEIRTSHQPEDRQVTWPRYAGDVARTRRRGDRMSGYVRLWHLETCRRPPKMSAFRAFRNYRFSVVRTRFDRMRPVRARYAVPPALLFEA